MDFDEMKWNTGHTARCAPFLTEIEQEADRYVKRNSADIIP